MEMQRREHQFSSNQHQIISSMLDSLHERAAAAPGSPALDPLGLGTITKHLEQHPSEIAQALRHRDAAIRAAAVQALSRRRKPAPLDELLRALHDEDGSVRAVAARALGLQGKRAPIDPLLTALTDPDWRVRAAAATALGRLEGRVPLAPLADALNDEHASVRAAVVYTLGTIQKSTQYLVAALQDKDWSVKEAAAMALQEQHYETVPTETLLSARENAEPTVQAAINGALEARFDERAGQKIFPQQRHSALLSWLYLGLSLISILALNVCMANWYWSYTGRFTLLAQGLLLVGVCCALIIINLLFQRQSLRALFRPNPVRQENNKIFNRFLDLILAATSVITLVISASRLLNTDFMSQPDITADPMYFVFIVRLFELGFIILTIIIINRAFHLRS